MVSQWPVTESRNVQSWCEARRIQKMARQWSTAQTLLLRGWLAARQVSTMVWWWPSSRVELLQGCQARKMKQDQADRPKSLATLLALDKFLERNLWWHLYQKFLKLAIVNTSWTILELQSKLRFWYFLRGLVRCQVMYQVTPQQMDQIDAVGFNDLPPETIVYILRKREIFALYKISSTCKLLNDLTKLLRRYALVIWIDVSFMLWHWTPCTTRGASGGRTSILNGGYRCSACWRWRDFTPPSTLQYKKQSGLSWWPKKTSQKFSTELRVWNPTINRDYFRGWRLFVGSTFATVRSRVRFQLALFARLAFF